MSKRSDEKGIRAILEQLEEWRHFPSYRLESRADIFFGLYMKEVISEQFNTKVDAVIPEFPLRLGLLNKVKIGRNEEANLKKQGDNQSVKVDFSAFSKDAVYLVELKTDINSYNREQGKCLNKAKRVGIRKLVEGIPELALHSNYQPKYVHLLYKLQELGYVELPEEINEYTFPNKKRGITKQLRGISIAKAMDFPKKIVTVYIIPNLKEDQWKNQDLKELKKHETITFEEFASVVASKGTMGKAFAKYLRIWGTTIAGESPPE